MGQRVWAGRSSWGLCRTRWGGLASKPGFEETCSAHCLQVGMLLGTCIQNSIVVLGNLLLSA